MTDHRDKPRFVVIQGGKSSLDWYAPKAKESTEKLKLRLVLKLIQTAQRYTSLNTETTLPWRAVMRAQMAFDELAAVEAYLEELIGVTTI